MKFLVKLLLVGILAFILLTIGGRLALPSVARSGVEQGAGSALGVSATLDDVEAVFGFENTALGMKGLVVDSPEGFDGAPLLEIGEACVEVGTFSLLSDTVHIPGITLSGLKLHLIQDGLKSNLKPVLDRIREQIDNTGAYSDQPSAPAPEAQENGSAGEVSGIAKMLAFGDVSLSEIGFSLELKGVPGMDAKRFEWTAPPFKFNLSDKANRARVQSVGDLSARLIEELEARGMAAADGLLPPSVLAILNGDTQLDGVLDGALGGLLDDAKGQLKQKQNELKTELEGDLKGAVKNLFGGK